MEEISEYAAKAGEAFGRLIATVEQLRDPGGCPWDAEQTHVSLRQHTLEEMYELLDAVDSEDADGIEEELGDLMTHVAFHTDIARRTGDFDAASTADRVRQKLIDRHPHVFAGAEQITDPDEVIDQWERLKRTESGKKSAVASLPASLPALALAGSVQRRTIKAGLKWPEAVDSEQKAVFETRQGETPEESEQRAAELLMQVSREIRQAGIDPEIALRTAAIQLRNRVLKAESIAGETALADLNEEERARAWKESGSSE